VCFYDAVGRVIQTFPEGKQVLGVTSLDNRLYVLLGNRYSEQIEVYDIDSYRLVHCLTVPDLGDVDDIVGVCMLLTTGSNSRGSPPDELLS